MASTTGDRPSWVRPVGIAVGTVVSIVGALYAWTVLLNVWSLSQAAAGVCAEAACDGGAISVVQIVGFALVVFGWFVPTGLFILRTVQRRRAWFWPPLALVIVTAALYLTVALLGGLLPA